MIVTGMYLLWAGRLGSFLWARINKQGKDSRFDDLKTDPKKFSGMWFGQALWITLVSLPVVLVNLSPARVGLGIQDLVGVALWAGGFGLEIVADRGESSLSLYSTLSILLVEYAFRAFGSPDLENQVQEEKLISEKSKWRQDKQDKKHNEKFISSGVWSLSRHPK